MYGEHWERRFLSIASNKCPIVVGDKVMYHIPPWAAKQPGLTGAVLVTVIKDRGYMKVVRTEDGQQLNAETKRLMRIKPEDENKANLPIDTLPNP